MINKYLPKTDPGTSSYRVSTAILTNHRGQNPAIQWGEEELIVLADGTTRTAPAGIMVTNVTEAELTETFPLLNTDTGEVIGEMLGAELLNAIVSYYIFAAMKRDAANAAAATPAQPAQS